MQRIKSQPKPPSELRVKRRRSSGFSHYHFAIQKPIQFGQNAPAAASTCRPYTIDGPSCQPRRRPQDATHRVDASNAPFAPPERHIAPAFVHGELRRASASPSGRSTAPPAEPVRPELRLDVLYLDVHSIWLAEHRWGRIADSVASSTSPEFTEITGNVDRPLWFTSGRDSSSYSFALSRSCSFASSTASPLPRSAGVTLRSAAEPPFPTASTLESSRARVK